MPGDIFGLRTNSSKLYDKQVDNTWPESANYGYFAGGFAPPQLCTIDRIDFSSETVSLPGSSLTKKRYLLAAVSNSNYGYFAGGNVAPNACTIDRIDFSSETVVVPPVGDQLTQARNSLTAVSNSNYGYFAGGFAPPYVCIIDRIDFSSETVVGPPIHGANLTDARSNLTAVSNSNHGYFAGGQSPSIVNTIDRIDFSSETVSLPGPSLTQARNNLGAVSTSDYGYFSGGGNPSVVNTIDRMDFSTETTSAPGNNLTEARNGLGAVSNSNYGYFAGGNTPPYVCTIDRIDFSTESVAVPPVGDQLTEARYAFAGVSGRQTRIRETTDKTASSVSGYGFYYGGGYPSANSPGQGNFVDYATETRTTNTELSTAYSEGSAFTTQEYGYHLGGNTTIVKRFDFLNDTRNDNPAAFPSAVRGQGSSTSHYGYICNSNNTPDLDGNKYDFSTETLSMVPDIISVTRFGSGNGCFTSSRYVHFTGGPSSSPALGSNYTHMDRLEFATETRSPLNAGGPTKFQKHSTAGCRSNDCGYSMGGSPGYQNTVDKIEFENDTISDAGTFSPQGRSNGALAVSKNYGYFCMGLNIVGGPSPSWRRNRMDRYDFSTSTNVNPPTTFANSAIRGTCMPQDVKV